MDQDVGQRFEQIEAAIYEQSVLLKQILARLNAPAPGSGDPVSTVPAGMAAVRPTGSRASVKVRYWPEPSADDFSAWGYVLRVAKMRDKDGHAWILPEQTGRLLRGTPTGTPAGASFAEIADRATYPLDWMSAADWEYEEALQKRDRELRAVWVSGDKPAEEAVAVEQGG